MARERGALMEDKQAVVIVGTNLSLNAPRPP